ncbi:MAG: hypothetical protein IJ385_01935 [Ruminiclostridium sp.]|nr:hypothetical protein [Ruminiclostridium sp.]
MKDKVKNRIFLLIALLLLCSCSHRDNVPISTVHENTIISESVVITEEKNKISTAHSAILNDDPNPGLSAGSFLVHKNEKYYICPEICYYIYKDNKYMMLKEGDPQTVWSIDASNLIEFEALDIIFNECNSIGYAQYVEYEPTAELETNLDVLDGAMVYKVDKEKFLYDMFIFYTQPVVENGVDIYKVTFADK